MEIYFDYFSSKNDVISQFSVSGKDLEQFERSEVIFASYLNEDYSGEALVIFKDGDKLYEVNESHCSCYGLQEWSPEETTKEALMMRSNYYGVWARHGDTIRSLLDEVRIDP